MGNRFKLWKSRTDSVPNSFEDVNSIVFKNRTFQPIEKLHYGDHGLEQTLKLMTHAIQENKRIALYADYDVDGTMSCVSWIWFLNHIGFNNFVHYIPCRFKEGYGVNLDAIKHLIENEKAELIITMDTGITANKEAKYCREHKVDFICTDHHKIQLDKIPDGIILNPKMHPDPLYQELCGCGITFVLLRKLAEHFKVAPALWTDLLALAGMATICDVVPLNAVNHKLAKMGVEALLRSERKVIKDLRNATQLHAKMDEKDVGFRLGPRINAVGRLGHANKIIEAFVAEDATELISHMEKANNERKEIQSKIVEQAKVLAKLETDAPVLFLGGEWHPGVVGIAASKIAESFWKPTWLFERKDGKGKGSARSILGFDVTEAMSSCGELFIKFGGHRAAGGFSFDLANEEMIKEKLLSYAQTQKNLNPSNWESSLEYDCQIPLSLLSLPLATSIENMKPFGHGFDEPKFLIEGEIVNCQFYKDKHTAVHLKTPSGAQQKIMFFNEVFRELSSAKGARFIVSASENEYMGRTSLSLIGHDFSC